MHLNDNTIAGIKINNKSLPITRHQPRLGEHTIEILKELDIKEDKIKKIVKKNLCSGLNCLHKNITTYLLLGNHDLEDKIKLETEKNEFIFLQTLLFYNFYDKDLLKPNDKKGVDNTGKDLTPFSVRWEDAAEAIKLALEIDLKKLPSRSEKYFIFADLPHNKFSNKKAKEQLRWSPKYNLKDVWNR